MVKQILNIFSLFNDLDVYFWSWTVQSISPDVRGGNSAPLTYRVVIVPANSNLRLGLGVEVHFVTRTETVLSLLTGRITDSFRQLGG